MIIVAAMKKMDWERVEGMTWEKLLGVYKVFKDNMMITWSMLMVIAGVQPQLIQGILRRDVFGYYLFIY